jgi:L-lysine exporter family protein LysE/ArgO
MAEVVQHVLLGLSVAVPLGPASVAVVEAGLRQGVGRALQTAAGVAMADATFLLIVYFGFSGVVQIAEVRILLLLSGALVLLCMGYRTIREAGLDADGGDRSIVRPGSPLLGGYLVNIVNPFAAVWWAATFGSMLSREAGEAAGPRALLRGAAVIAGILLWHSAVALLTHWGRRVTSGRVARVLAFFAGGVLILFALRFGCEGVQVVLCRMAGG